MNSPARRKNTAEIKDDFWKVKKAAFYPTFTSSRSRVSRVFFKPEGAIM